MISDKIEIDITLRCNLSCNNCDRMSPQPVDISIESIKSFLALNLPWKEVRLLGGEPCLHPQIRDIIDLFLDTKYNVSMFTNGINDFVVHSKIHKINTRKSAGVQPLFKPFHVAPIDIGITSGFERGCIIPDQCGMCLSVDGLYYPCGAGATVSRAFNLGIGKVRPEDVTHDDMAIVCRYCGHFRYKSFTPDATWTTEKTVSQSWEGRV